MDKQDLKNIKRVCGNDFHYSDVPAYMRRDYEKTYEKAFEKDMEKREAEGILRVEQTAEEIDDILKHDIENKIRLDITFDLEDDAREVNE